MEILIIVLWIVITFFVGSIAGIIGKRYGVAYPIALVSALVVMANIFANKIVQFGSFTVPAGVITFSMIFFITDLISERWGKIEARKAVWAGLMSEEAKQKQIAIEKTPRETIITYWFDTDSFAILKEESYSYATECGGSSATIGGGSSEGDCREIEIKVERTYEGFYFDVSIPDSEFEINPSDYLGIEFKKEIVDTQEKFD